MDVTPAGMVMSVRAVAPLNASFPMDASWLPAAKVTVVRLLVPKNARDPMDVTPAGMVIAVRDKAKWNAYIPMDVSWLLAAKVTVARLLVLKNA
jgi:hypothetical protein